MIDPVRSARAPQICAAISAFSTGLATGRPKAAAADAAINRFDDAIRD
jgi:hypothetical protein